MIAAGIGLALALASQAAPAPAPQEPPAAPARAKGADLLLLEEVRRIGGKVETLRGESFARPPLAVRAPEEFLQVMAEGRTRSVVALDRLEARERAWQDLGLEASPLKILQALARDLDGIGFDPEANRLLVTPERLSGQEFAPSEGEPSPPATLLMLTGMRPDEPLVSHLLMHVRQRERSKRDHLGSTTDRLLARAAWAEGEANLVAVRYLYQEVGLEDDALSHTRDPGALLDGALLPNLQESLNPTERALIDFVYLEGFHQAVVRYLDGGWPALGTALAGPATTRAVLHPKSPGKEPASFAEGQPPRPDLALIDEDSLGEQTIVVLVSQLTGKDNLGLLAGAGWNGDVLRRWEGEGGSITEWITRWDSEDGQRDFLYGLERGLGERSGATFEPEGEPLRRMRTNGVLHEILVEGAEVRLRVVSPSLAGAYLSAP